MQNLIKRYSETFFFSLSVLMERAAYYGLRSLILLYLAGDIMKMELADALIIYGWMITAIPISQIIGGILGDLFIGNKKSILFGGVIQGVGAFVLAIPSSISLYIGLFLVVLGTGLYTPNLTSNFGKSYLNKPKFLDAGFTILYMAINVGSFLGAFLIGYIGEKFGFSLGFLLAGFLGIISIFPVLVTPKYESRNTKTKFTQKKTFNIAFALIIVGLFWAFYETSGVRINEVKMELIQNFEFSISKSWLISADAWAIIPLSLAAIIAWNYIFQSQFLKIFIGFVFGVLGFIFILSIPESPEIHHTTILLIAMGLLSIAEVHIAPAINSILTRYSNPKYLAIIFGIAYIPTQIFALALGEVHDLFNNNSITVLYLITAAMILTGLIVLIYLFLDKKFKLQGDY